MSILHAPARFVFLSGLLITLILSGVHPTTLNAQNTATIAGKDVSLRFGFTVQPRFTYAFEDGDGADLERMGFGLRRFRVRTYTDIGDNFRVFTQLDGSGTSAVFLDMRGEYKVADNLWLRFGRFAGAHPRVMAITLHSEIDMIDRPGMAAVWARNTIGADARDYGLELFYRVPVLEYRVFVSNGDNRLNFRNEINNPSAAGGISNTGLAASTLLRYYPQRLPGTEFGGYAGVNFSRNPNTEPTPLVRDWYVVEDAANAGRSYASASLHAYWGVRQGEQPVRIKADALWLRYEPINLIRDSQSNAWMPGTPVRYTQTMAGMSLMGAWLMRKDVEFAASVETYNTDIDFVGTEVRLASLSGTYSFSAAAGEPFLARKLTLGYSVKSETGRNRVSHLLVLSMQILL